MRRVELLALASVAGCMRIYPDSELPDLKVTWDDFDCTDSVTDIGVVVTGVDTPATVLMQTVPCTDLEVKFVDVARERFHVEGAEYDAGGTKSRDAEVDADLRAGFNKSASLFFQPFENYTVEWTFTNGDSCASLGATDVAIYFSQTGFPPDSAAQSAPCTAMFITNILGAGTYTARLRANDSNGLVAASPETALFELVEKGFTDIGLQQLTACSGSACP